MKFRALMVATICSATFLGCGGSSVKEGVPDSVDFSGKTDYSPKAAPFAFSPDDAKKVEAKAAAEAAAKGETK
jgi:hypothetical protein